MEAGTSRVKRGMPNRWFVATPFTPLYPASGRLILPSGALAHAKRMGTERSACGLRTETWQRLWEWEFPNPNVHNCERCKTIVEQLDNARG